MKMRRNEERDGGREVRRDIFRLYAVNTGEKRARTRGPCRKWKPPVAAKIKEEEQWQRLAL